MMVVVIMVDDDGDDCGGAGGGGGGGGVGVVGGNGGAEEGRGGREGGRSDHLDERRRLEVGVAHQSHHRVPVVQRRICDEEGGRAVRMQRQSRRAMAGCGDGGPGHVM